MSTYAGDPQVVLHGDGSATVLRVVWEPEDWQVVASGDGGFIAVSGDGYLAVVRGVDGELVPWRFESRDAAIGSLVHR